MAKVHASAEPTPPPEADKGERTRAFDRLYEACGFDPSDALGPDECDADLDRAWVGRLFGGVTYLSLGDLP